MPQIIITSRQGQERLIEATSGFSLMQAIVNHGDFGLLALCGGVMACATCHVYVDEAFLPTLAPVSADEDEILNSTTYREKNSRLSCQIPVSDDLAGMRVTIAPE